MRDVRAALAFVLGCLAAIAFYAALRVHQAVTTAEPDPTLVIYSAHAGYFWRAWTAAYAGGGAAAVAWLLGTARMARALPVALPVAVGAAVLQAAFFP